MSDDKDMMMLRFKTAIDRELSRSEAPNAKKTTSRAGHRRAENAAAHPTARRDQT